MLNRNVETFIGCDNEYEESKIVIFGAPFDSTTSFRPGTRFASKAMRGESFGIETYSPYQDKDLEDIAVFDGGDLELSFGNTTRALGQIEDFTTQILEDGKIPCMIGGEHLVTLGAMRAVAKKHPDLHVIQFDAHADLREDYLGETLSHATVIHRVWDLLGDDIRLEFINKFNQFFHIISINLSRLNFSTTAVQFFFQRITFRNCTACDTDFFEYVRNLTTFMNNYSCNSTSTNN